MITCAKCHTKFPIEVNKITKDSMIPCVNCNSPCLVKLFDLEHHVENATHQYGGFSEIKQNFQTPNIELKHEYKNDIALHKHFVITTLIFKVLLIAFIFGIIEIQFLDEKFPMLSKFYRAINILPRKTIIVSGIDIHLVKLPNDQKNLSLEMDIKLTNISEKTDLISDVTVIALDVFHNIIGVSEIQPHIMLKRDSTFDLKFTMPPMTNDARYVSVFLNGKIQLEKVNIQK